jgi:hypothetical protein
MGESALAEYLASARPDAAPIVTAIDAAIRAAAPLATAIKWRQLTYGVDGDFHHWICALAVTKKQVTLNFHFGALLADPEGAFRQGTSKFMRMLDYTSPEAVDAGLIARRVTEAVARLDYFKANWQRIQAGDQAVTASSD